MKLHYRTNFEDVVAGYWVSSMKLTEVDGSNSCIWASQPLPLSIQLPTRCEFIPTFPRLTWIAEIGMSSNIVCILSAVSVPPTDPWSRIKRASAGLYIWRVTVSTNIRYSAFVNSSYSSPLMPYSYIWTMHDISLIIMDKNWCTVPGFCFWLRSTFFN